MKDPEKKAFVFELLSKEIEPISLPNLRKKLGRKYAERTLRRWLLEMIEAGTVTKIGKQRATKYLIASAPKATKLLLEQEGFSQESVSIIQKIKKPIHTRKLTAYNDAWLEEYKPNKTYYFSQDMRNELYAYGKKSHQELPAGTYAHQIFHRLLIDLSYNSSRLEGNTYSLLDTQKLLLEGKSPEGKLEEEKIMILNHKEAIRYMVDHATTLTLTNATICTLHYLLADGLVEPKYAGKLRDYGVRIGGSTYIPFENPKLLEKKLTLITTIAKDIQDPYEQSLFLLIHITYLQAFVDVNKRLARLCANIPLIQNNLVPLSFNDVSKDDYICAVLSIYEFQKIQPLIDLYAFSYIRSCDLYASTVHAIGVDELRVKYRYQRRSLVRDIIIQKLTGKKLSDFIYTHISSLIPSQDQAAVQEDLLEDLAEMDENRLVGLGVTQEEFWLWKKSRFE